MRGSSVRILIAEDDEGVRETLTAWFEHYGDEAAPCSTAAEVLEQLKSEEPCDLAVVDIWLGGSGGALDSEDATDGPLTGSRGEPAGFEVVRAVRHAWPDCRVVMITGDEDLPRLHPRETVDLHALRRKPVSAAELRYVAFQDTPPRPWGAWVAADRRVERIGGERAREDPDPRAVPYDAALDRIAAIKRVRAAAFVEYRPQRGLARAIAVRGALRRHAFEETTSSLADSILARVSQRGDGESGLSWDEAPGDDPLGRVCDARRIIAASIWATGPVHYAMVAFDERADPAPELIGTVIRESAKLVEPLARWWLIAERRADDAAIRIGRYYGVYSHELRNPLSTLRNLADLIAESGSRVESLMERVAEDARELYNASFARKALDIRELAADAARESARFTQRAALLKSEISAAWDIVERYRELFRMPRRERVDVNDVLREIEPMLRHRLRSSGDPRVQGIRFRVQPSAEPLIVSGAKVYILQILMNLLDNAIEWARPHRAAPDAEEAPAAVWVRSSLDAEAGNAVIDVGNTGYGIVAPLGRIWRPGFTTRSDGCGLGLAIVRGTVRQELGGEVTVAENRNPGNTVFRVTIPIETGMRRVEADQPSDQ